MILPVRRAQSRRAGHAIVRADDRNRDPLAPKVRRPEASCSARDAGRDRRRPTPGGGLFFWPDLPGCASGFRRQWPRMPVRRARRRRLPTSARREASSASAPSFIAEMSRVPWDAAPSARPTVAAPLRTDAPKRKLAENSAQDQSSRELLPVKSSTSWPVSIRLRRLQSAITLVELRCFQPDPFDYGEEPRRPHWSSGRYDR